MKHLLKLLDLSKEDIIHTLNIADQLKYERKHGIAHRVLEGKAIGLLFAKASTRTRISFEIGAYQLGAHATYLKMSDMQLDRGETIMDTARVLSGYFDALMIRTYEQQEVEDFAKYGSIPIINGLTDFAHPCQVLADLMTIREHKSVLEGLKMCYVGDGNNMANSLIVGGLKTGMEVSIVCPEGYMPHKQVLDFAHTCSGFSIHSDPKQGVKDADVIITDTWISMGQEDERARREQAFAGYCVDENLMALAKPDAMVQHCLPAHKGEEISEDVFEAHAREIFDEAENRLHAQKAVMAVLLRQ